MQVGVGGASGCVGGDCVGAVDGMPTWSVCCYISVCVSSELCVVISQCVRSREQGQGGRGRDDQPATVDLRVTAAAASPPAFIVFRVRIIAARIHSYCPPPRLRVRVCTCVYVCVRLNGYTCVRARARARARVRVHAHASICAMPGTPNVRPPQQPGKYGERERTHATESALAIQRAHSPFPHPSRHVNPQAPLLPPKAHTLLLHTPLNAHAPCAHAPGAHAPCAHALRHKA